jgi:hypothetical protein
MNYPTIQQVEQADREQLCRWYRFLLSPSSDEQFHAMEAICDRLRALGGFTPELSKKIGWKESYENSR